MIWMMQQINKEIVQIRLAWSVSAENEPTQSKTSLRAWVYVIGKWLTQHTALTSCMSIPVKPVQTVQRWSNISDQRFWSVKNCWKLLPQGWICYFRHPTFQKSPRGACPRIPKENAPSTLVVCPPPPQWFYLYYGTKQRSLSVSILI